MKIETESHESYGNISISRFTGGRGQFFGSDLEHSGGITMTISNAEKTRRYGGETVFAKNDLIEIKMTNNQFIDAITSGMNTSGVPCTIHRFNGDCIPQVNHIEDKKEVFSNDMKDTHKEYYDRIDLILELLNGNIGKRKVADIKHELEVLKNHIASNTNFVMTTFNEAMEKSVTEAKHSIANYIDHKVHSLGIESLRNQLDVSIETSDLNKAID